MTDKDQENSFEKQLEKAKEYIYSLLSRRMYTKKEIINKLKKKRFSEDVLNSAIATVERYGYIDDKRFAEEWIRSRRHKEGNLSLRYELLSKGIEREIIDEVLDQFKDGQDEMDIALSLAYRRIELYRNDDPKSVMRKIYNFLIRHGFSSETAYKVIEKIFNQQSHCL